MKNESRARMLLEQSGVVADNLKATQLDRAVKLRQTNEKKRFELASALENEVLLKV